MERMNALECHKPVLIRATAARKSQFRLLSNGCFEIYPCGPLRQRLLGCAPGDEHLWGRPL